MANLPNLIIKDLASIFLPVEGHRIKQQFKSEDSKFTNDAKSVMKDGFYLTCCLWSNRLQTH
jgi:hypothetical protein